MKAQGDLRLDRGTQDGGSVEGGEFNINDRRLPMAMSLEDAKYMISARIRGD